MGHCYCNDPACNRARGKEVNIVFQSIVNSILRKLLAGVGAALVTDGWIESGTWEQILGGVIVFAASVAWGAWEKYVRPELNKLPQGGE